MPAVKKPKKREADQSVFDDGDALLEIATKAFERAAKRAVAENDRLGIPTHGTRHGKLVVRKPKKAAATSEPR